MTRIFLTSSHFCTILMTAYARSTPGQTKDFLILDAGRRKAANVQQLEMAASLHQWAGVFDFSEVLANENDTLPGTKKRITRRLKTLPVFRSVYNKLLQNYQGKISREKQEELRKLIGAVDKNETVQLFLLKETSLNDALKSLFKGAVVNYFEHGLSDYLLMVNDPPKGNGKFYCVFAEGFNRYLEKRKIAAGYSESFADSESFRKMCGDYFSHHPEQVSLLQSFCPQGKKYALVILQPFENIQVESQKCWEGFLDKCFSTAGQQEIHYLIKPHPLQSQKEIGFVENYLAARGLSFTVSKENISAISIELAFSVWKEQISYVFSPYSSAVFYLSKLFPGGQTKYCFAYEYMRPFLRATPPSTYQLFDLAGPMIKEVFSENCVEI